MWVSLSPTNGKTPARVCRPTRCQPMSLCTARSTVQPMPPSELASTTAATSGTTAVPLEPSPTWALYRRLGVAGASPLERGSSTARTSSSTPPVSKSTTKVSGNAAASGGTVSFGCNTTRRHRRHPRILHLQRHQNRAQLPQRQPPHVSGYVLSAPEYLTVFDGRTGRAMDTVDHMPPWSDSYNNQGKQFLYRDCLPG